MQDAKTKMIEDRLVTVDEAFLITAEQLKFWMAQDVSPQEAMEALEIRANRITGAGWKKADWMDVGLALVKTWADH